MKIKNKKFVYLISPNKIDEKKFFQILIKVLNSNKVSFFQLRLKNDKLNKKIRIAKKVSKICKKFNVKFLVNDDPNLANLVKADGCHLGQKDMNIYNARKILRNKIIGITCHNSIKLAKKAAINKASYIAIGAFNKSKTKNVVYRASFKILRKIKSTVKLPIVAIGGINEKNYNKLLLNKADFLAMSGYIWKNNELSPLAAIKKLK